MKKIEAMFSAFAIICLAVFSGCASTYTDQPARTDAALVYFFWTNAAENDATDMQYEQITMFKEDAAYQEYRKAIAFGKREWWFARDQFTYMWLKPGEQKVIAQYVFQAASSSGSSTLKIGKEFPLGALEAGKTYFFKFVLAKMKPKGWLALSAKDLEWQMSGKKLIPGEEIKKIETEIGDLEPHFVEMQGMPAYGYQTKDLTLASKRFHLLRLSEEIAIPELKKFYIRGAVPEKQ